MNLQATFAATLVDEWARSGVTDAVVAPGSRSTPLAVALADHRGLRLHVLLDERSAGFFAVGLGQASGRPAVVLTTSGTAAVEVHPAVVEADQGRVPMVVCTADRPAELHGVCAPQTVVQRRLFGESVRWFVEPGVADPAARGWWRSLASRAVAEAVAGPAGPGPVHLNLAFRDPLVGEPGPLPEGRPGGRPWHRAAASAGGAPAEVAGLLSGRRGVVVAGRGSGGGAAVRALGEALAWPVLADPRSGARGGPASVAAFDALLRPPRLPAAGEVEVVLRLGDPPASKALATWLAEPGVGAAGHVVVDPFGRWPDPERRADVVIAADPGRFCADVAAGRPAPAGPAPAGWLAAWRDAEARAQGAIERVLAARPAVTEPGVARALTAGLPADVALFVSSSMPVRDLEWYGSPASGHLVLANRGANGIDGVVSTALGVAAARRGDPVVALVGDLAFLHDAGGLLWARRRDLRCVIVVVDNDGGGIFSFLPQAEALGAERFEALFGTPHGLDLAAVAAAYGVPTTAVDKADEVVPAVEAALARG
ncbi:MAG TPA: 2-succinyl-5-enolpyruvyl-6-hydroxy-3-cyclohexene-1-carboxylic-acid synthase, partial [Acidimicrobiales bacterium]|nr:2-succinyl-5-enolpyruvyl-6-hydroxy-3-cyclohexene-1-carboxylic-acid synthase [Acidimicrobiales bacterium]